MFKRRKSKVFLTEIDLQPYVDRAIEIHPRALRVDGVRDSLVARIYHLTTLLEQGDRVGLEASHGS